MARYDAFGRKIGEDPLAEFGWRTTPEAPPAHAAPPVAPPPVAPPPARRPGTAQPSPIAPPRPRRWPVRLVVLGIVIWGLGSFVTGLDVEGTNSGTAVTVTGGPEPAAPAGHRSFIRAQELGPALDSLRRARLGKITQLTVRPDRIFVSLVTGGGRGRVAQILPGPKVETLSTAGPGSGTQDTVPYEGIEVRAPQRLLRAAARRMKRRAGQVDYVVLTRFGEASAWIVYFKDGSYAFGDEAGRFVRAYD
jgi:hypothetical protein